MKKERKERKKGVQNRVRKGVCMGGPEGVQMGVQQGVHVLHRPAWEYG